MNKLVICDLDGTIIDSRKDLATSINLMLKDVNLPEIDVDTVTGYVGNGARKLVERALNGKYHDAEHALKIFKKYYKKNILNETIVYPTVPDGLEKLHKNNIKLSLISNKPSENCIEILQHFNLDKYFDVVFGGDEKHPLKPDPKTVVLSIEKTNATKENSWIIGDSLADLNAGRNAGIKCCYAEYGFFQLNKNDFDYSVDTFAKFADFILQFTIK